MPYITKQRRIDFFRGALGDNEASSPGELNYLFTLFSTWYVKNKGLSYQTINDVLGALEGCKQEFYRRVAVPYEQEKIKANGDVY